MTCSILQASSLAVCSPTPSEMKICVSMVCRSKMCFAAIGAMNAEMKSAKWLWGGIGLQLGIGYSVAYLVYTIGTLITDADSLNLVAAVIGGAVVLIMVAVVMNFIRKTDKKLKEEYSAGSKPEKIGARV